MNEVHPSYFLDAILPTSFSSQRSGPNNSGRKASTSRKVRSAPVIGSVASCRPVSSCMLNLSNANQSLRVVPRTTGGRRDGAAVTFKCRHTGMVMVGSACCFWIILS